MADKVRSRYRSASSLRQSVTGLIELYVAGSPAHGLIMFLSKPALLIQLASTVRLGLGNQLVNTFYHNFQSVPVVACYFIDGCSFKDD
jgi:hypothetical protein